MGDYIRCHAEIKRDRGWERVGVETFIGFDGEQRDQPFSWQDYDMYAVLTGIRNDSQVTPIMPDSQKGLPKDCSYDTVDHYIDMAYVQPMSFLVQVPKPTLEEHISHAKSEHEYFGEGYIFLNQLNDFDYSKTIVDVRDNQKEKSIREFIGQSYFDDLAALNELAGDNQSDCRIVFWFK